MATGRPLSGQQFMRTRSESDECFEDVSYSAVKTYKKHKRKNVNIGKKIRPRSYSDEMDIFSDAGAVDSGQGNTFNGASDPYTSVSSFKCYRKFSADGTAMSSKPNHTEQFDGESRNSEPIFIDDTVVSAYDAAKHFKICDKHRVKPPLPNTRHLVRHFHMDSFELDTSSTSEASDATSAGNTCMVVYDNEVDKQGSERVNFDPPQKLLEQTDHLARSLPLKPNYSLELSGLNNQLRNTIGPSHLLDKDIDWSDSGSVSPTSGNSRPNSAGSGRRKLPTVPKRNIFSKSNSAGALAVDVVPKPRELTLPTKFNKIESDCVENRDDNVDNLTCVKNVENVANVNDEIKSEMVTRVDTVIENVTSEPQSKIKPDEKPTVSNKGVNKVPNTKDRKPKLLPKPLKRDNVMTPSVKQESACKELLKNSTDTCAEDTDANLDTDVNKVNIIKDINPTSKSETKNENLVTEEIQKDVDGKTNIANSPSVITIIHDDEGLKAPSHVLSIPNSKERTLSESETLDAPIQPHAFFNFNPSVIQELTDSVMGGSLNGTGTFEVSTNNTGDTLGGTGTFEVSDNCEVIGDEELQVLNDMDAEIDKAANVDNGVTDQSKVADTLVVIEDCSDIDMLRNKLGIEGKSHRGNGYKANQNLKNLQDTKDTMNERKAASENIEHENALENNKENIHDTQGHGKTKIERTPSYRRHIMARAKNRYSKKSSMHKECSCIRNESGDIVVCRFCENYEYKKRSRSCLGLGIKNVSKNDGTEDNDSGLYSGSSSPRRALTPNGLPHRQMSNSPRPVRRIQVSSRVDVLMSSDLFRKHLYKHENLLQKHTMFRRSGMRKSVSNIDLTEGFIVDSDQDCCVSIDAGNKDNPQNEVNDKTDRKSVNEKTKVETRSKSRRHSLTGDSEALPENLTNVIKKKKPYSTLPKSIGRSRPGIPSFSESNNNLRSSNRCSYIPSFGEFKRMKGSASPCEGNDKHLIDAINNSHENSTFEQKEYTRNEESEGLSVHSSDTDTSGVVPLQLQVITEGSGSQEQLLNAGVENNAAHLRISSEQAIIQSSQDNTERKTKAILNNKVKTSHARPVSKSKQSNDSHSDNSNSSEKAAIPKAAPSEKLKQRMRPKVKSKVLVRVESELLAFSDTNEPNGTGVVLREKRKPGTKRPRSLISKKSSLESLVQSENKDCNSDVDSQPGIRERPKLKVRSRSESRNNLRSPVPDSPLRETAKSQLSVKQGSSSEKGHNSVSSDPGDNSCYSPFDIGESEETSTSQAESLSDSIRSEVRIN